VGAHFKRVYQMRTRSETVAFPDRAGGEKIGLSRVQKAKGQPVPRGESHVRGGCTPNLRKRSLVILKKTMQGYYCRKRRERPRSIPSPKNWDRGRRNSSFPVSRKEKGLRPAASVTGEGEVEESQEGGGEGMKAEPSG